MHREAASFVSLAVHFYPAAMLAYDAIRERQAQVGAAANRFKVVLQGTHIGVHKPGGVVGFVRNAGGRLTERGHFFRL